MRRCNQGSRDSRAQQKISEAFHIQGGRGLWVENSAPVEITSGACDVSFQQHFTIKRTLLSGFVCRQQVNVKLESSSLERSEQCEGVTKAVVIHELNKKFLKHSTTYRKASNGQLRASSTSPASKPVDG